MACLLAVLVRLEIGAATPLRDPDTWWHLRAGHEFWGAWTPWHTGQLTRAATRGWVPTEWLSEMVVAKISDWFGLPGVAWAFGAVLVALVLALYTVSRQRASSLPATVATALGVAATSGSLSPRPQVLSFVLLAAVVGAWVRTSSDLRPRWWLVPLTWLWACLHGMWIAAVIVGLGVSVGIILDHRLEYRRACRLLAVPLLSLVAAGLTPVGPALMATPFVVNARTSMITEWQAASLRDGPGLIVVLMLATVGVCWARRGAVAWSQLAVWLMAGGWAVLSARTLALAGVLAAPLLAAALQDLLGPKRAPTRLTRPELRFLLVGGFACLVALALVVPHTSRSPAGVPRALNARLHNLPPKSVVLNAYTLGGWLEWRHPRLNPVIDGLADAYPVSYFRAYVRTLNVQPGWRNFVQASGADVAVLEGNTRLADALHNELGWRGVQTDNGWVYLVAPGN